VTRIDPESTGLNPNWRKSLALLGILAGWADGASSFEINSIQDRVDKATDILDVLSPESAAYFNEVKFTMRDGGPTLIVCNMQQASLTERDFKKSFFGSHYDKLKSIKKKYDPHSLFLVAKGVGSEDWDDALNCPK
jgi:hypothetical protein